MTIILARERLYTAVWITPIGQLARQLGITSARLRDACMTMAVPLPPLGYWNAHKAGNNPIATPLPPHNGLCEVRIGAEKRVSPPRTVAPATKPASVAQPRLVPIAVWAAMVFGEHAPHSNTLLRWIHDGRIQPQARKIGRKWWVAPTAEYRED
ncbi:hypothetical protein HHL21_12015 [Massilia sp. RP-1-19]|uniref:Excisionase-like domain-containing protein n=1 Tax=Massilia polaris TaxID=2728846 RepID=A0A848HKV3_9BURK|nr:excisionase [Massilia polaris]NML61792.1 hypothetical protein [Massilia polaris]